MKVRIASVAWFLPGLIACACLSVAQAQVFLPGEPAAGAQNPSVDMDPDIFNTFTDSGGAARSDSQFNCTSDPMRPCHGGLLTRFANPSIDGDGNLVFDWQVKAAQPPETSVANFLTNRQRANLLGRLRLSFFINTGAFGSGSGNTAADWGPGCAVIEGAPIEELSLEGGTVAYATVGDLDDILQLQLANEQSVTQRSDFSLLERIVIPHDQYLQMARISCPVTNSSQPAKVAFSGLMMGEASQRIATAAGQSAALDIQRYAPIADNNLWYYPLDGSPAIVNAELGAASPGLAYLDLTFSEPVVLSGTDVFNGAVEMGGMQSTVAAVVEPPVGPVALTIDRVVHLSSTVVRVHLSDDLQTVAEGLSATSPYFVFVTPPATGIVDADTNNPLHSGDDWRLAVFFDHQAPRIEEAEVTANSESIELAFSEPVQFGVQFTGNPPVVSNYATNAIPSPLPEDFRIVLRGEDGAAIDEFSPAAISTSEGGSVGFTSLTLEMPPSPANPDGEYFATQTVDVRIADRLKDLTHPSLASVFTFVNNTSSVLLTTVELKTSKFGNDTGANFPRTAAFAQVGSLPLRGREYEIEAVRATESVATGDEVTLRFRLAGLIPLKAGETVRVAFTLEGIGGLDLDPPSDIVFTRDNASGLDVVWRPNREALDADRLPDAEVIVSPSVVGVDPSGLLVAAGNASSATTVIVSRVFYVEADPNVLSIRGVGTAPMVLQISDRGAGLVAGDSALTVRFFLEIVPPSSPATVTSEQILASSADIHVGIIDLDGGLYDIQVGFTSATPTASIDLAVVDAALPVIDTVLIGAGPGDVRFAYTGSDQDCEGIAGCIATVSSH